METLIHIYEESNSFNASLCDEDSCEIMLLNLKQNWKYSPATLISDMNDLDL